MPEDARFRLEALELLEPDQLLIVWGDGHESLYPYSLLRRACACARCLDEWTGRPLLDPAGVARDIRVVQWSPTGRYGVNLRFSDGHATGIYTLTRLRELCPCPVCSAAARS